MPCVHKSCFALRISNDNAGVADKSLNNNSDRLRVCYKRFNFIHTRLSIFDRLSQKSYFLPYVCSLLHLINCQGDWVPSFRDRDQAGVVPHRQQNRNRLLLSCCNGWKKVILDFKSVPYRHQQTTQCHSQSCYRLKRERQRLWQSHRVCQLSRVE